MAAQLAIDFSQEVRHGVPVTRQAPAARMGPGLPSRTTWAEFVEANPAALRLLVAWARAEKGLGRTRVSMKALFERLRANLSVELSGGNGWRLDNSWTAEAARMLAAQHPDLAGLFEFRKRKGEG